MPTVARTRVRQAQITTPSEMPVAQLFFDLVTRNHYPVQEVINSTSNDLAVLTSEHRASDGQDVGQLVALSSEQQAGSK